MGTKQSVSNSNHLIGSTSPYLLQHAHNPVDWYPWGEESIEKARGEDKPIFLSIGYSACHWCHVMARESFEDPHVAEVLNGHFISIKVDREERPDLDEIYMAAVIAMTGAGGWPMSVFLTPDLKPFYGGTYFPPEDRWGQPAFHRVLEAVAYSWRDRRDTVINSAEGLAGHVLARLDGRGAAVSENPSLDWELLNEAVGVLVKSFDPVDGGWGGAPKFPSSGSIELLLRQWRRTGDAQALHMATFTLDRMARSGMYDHVGGGFHRYAVDEKWLVPHFEKMLYDNAQLAVSYIEAFQATGHMHFRRVAAETLNYVLRDLCGEQGQFLSSEDADSEGQEGRFYLWTKQEMLDVLGHVQGEMFARFYGLSKNGTQTPAGQESQGENILHMVCSLEEFAKEMGFSTDRLDTELTESRKKLRSVREKRVRPGKDEKVVAAWNGLMISAVSRGAQVLEKCRYSDAAVKAGHFLLEHMYTDGVLSRTWHGGRVGGPGFLADYACVANGFLDLYETTFDPSWLLVAHRFAETILDEFGDDYHPLLRMASERHTDLIARVRPVQDGSEPSGNTMAALMFLRLSQHVDEPDWRSRAGQILDSQIGMMTTLPMAFTKMLCSVDLLLGDPVKIMVACGGDGPAAEQAFLSEIHSRFLPHLVLTRSADVGIAHSERTFATRNKPIDGMTTAYLCTPDGCDRPYMYAHDLAIRLDRPSLT